jgi:hypothetical protein
MQVSLTNRDNYMNYAEGTKRVALVVYLVWAAVLLGVVMLICAGNSNWFVAKMTFVALALPLISVAEVGAKGRLFALFIVAIIVSLIEFNFDFKADNNTYFVVAISVLPLISGAYEKNVTTLAVSSMFLSWAEKPKASFALMMVYMVAASSVFSWAVIHFSPDADIALRVATLFFPCIAVLAAWIIASFFAMVTGFVADGFQQNR